MKLYKKTFMTPIAEFTVISGDSYIIKLSFGNDKCEGWLKRYLGKVEFSGENELTRRCEYEVRMYTEGKLKRFSLPTKLYGTPFQKKVWNALLKVPYGQTTTYAGLAKLAGAGGARAAGAALRENPIPIIYPCHRVIRADGSVGGFCGGYEMSDLKSALLALERNSLIHDDEAEGR